MDKKLFAIIIGIWVWTNAQAYDFRVWGVYFNLHGNDEVSVTTDKEPYSGFVNIPDSIVVEGKTYRVTAIDDRAFNVCSGLTSLRLPNTLRTIGQGAFSACTSLGYVKIPEGVEFIGDAAFYGCASLLMMQLPASVSHIGREAFARCSRLERITVDERNEHYKAVDGVLYNKVGITLLAFPGGKGETFHVPADVNEICASAFMGCTKLKHVTVSNGVTSIGDAAFYGCDVLQELELPESLKSIGCWAVAECNELKRVTIPAGVESIGEDAFSFCGSLENIFVGNGSLYFASDNGVLMNKERTTVVCCPGAKNGTYLMPEGVTAVNNHAFYGSNALSEIFIPASTTDMKDNPFVFCDALEQIVVDGANRFFASYEGTLCNKDLTEILAFPNGKKGTFALPNTIADISSKPFMMSKQLTRLSLPESLKTIGEYAFLGCEALTAVNIPRAVEAIGENAFADCHALQRIICSDAPVENQAFANDCFLTARVAVPAAWLGDYMGCKGWESFRQVNSFGIYLPQQPLQSGTRQVLPVLIYNEVPLSSVTTTIVLPEGMTIPNDNSGLPMVQLGENSQRTHNLSCQRTDQGYRLTVTPNDNEVLPVGDKFCLITLDIDESMPNGIKEIAMNNTTVTYSEDGIEGDAAQKDHAYSFYVSDTIDGILQIEAEPAIGWPTDVYNMQGMPVRKNAYDLKGLPAGIYIVNGHKLIVK